MATKLGKDEMPWRHVTIRRPTAVEVFQEAAIEPGAAAQMGERVDNDEAREQPRGCARHSEDDKQRTGKRTRCSDDSLVSRNRVWADERQAEQSFGGRHRRNEEMERSEPGRG